METFADLCMLFSMFDRDGSGYISAGEFKYSLVSKMCILKQREADALIKELDQDGDGEVGKIRLQL